MLIAMCFSLRADRLPAAQDELWAGRDGLSGPMLRAQRQSVVCCMCSQLHSCSSARPPANGHCAAARAHALSNALAATQTTGPASHRTRCPMAHVTHLSNDDEEAGDFHDHAQLLHDNFCRQALAVLIQEGALVGGIARVMGHTPIQDAQNEADYADRQEDKAPAVNAQGVVATCTGEGAL